MEFLKMGAWGGFGGVSPKMVVLAQNLTDGSPSVA